MGGAAMEARSRRCCFDRREVLEEEDRGPCCGYRCCRGGRATKAPLDGSDVERKKSEQRRALFIFIFIFIDTSRGGPSSCSSS